MATSAQTIVDALDAAILVMQNGGGAQSIRFADGRTVTYQTLPDALKARAYYQSRADAAANSDTGGLGVSKVTFKGDN